MKYIYYILLSLFVTYSCIGTDVVDDFVEARVSIDNPVTSLKAGDSYQFRATYLNNVGLPEETTFLWMSSDESILEIDNDGLAVGINMGDAAITATAKGVSSSSELMVSDTTIGAITERTAELKTVSSYPLSGNAILRKDEGIVTLLLDDNFSTTSALPGLYVYLTNNVATINNALEVGKVLDFEGTQVYEIEEDIELTEYNFVLFYCKPFLVPVGNGELKP